MKMRMKMKKWILLFTCISFLALTGNAFTLSKEAEISVLTCSPGEELYSLFGHTAIRVHDPVVNYDMVYNYGTFDFDTPHFYLKYAQGLLPYQLAHSSFDSFLRAYKIEKRSVYSQTLKLDSLQKQKLFDLLLENYRPENRFYLYNFLFDNCTTRSRDILAKSLTENIDWGLPDSGKNFWNLLDEYLQPSPWVQWGIHTILGQRGNLEASTFQYMFLPDYFMYGLNTARINGQRLAEDDRLLYQAPESTADYPWYRHPLFVFGLGTILLIFLLYKFRRPFFLNSVAFIVFLFTGIVGCLIVFLGGFTEHPMTAPNWNILWANPLNLIALFFVVRKNLPTFVRLYLKIYITLLTIALPVWVLAQPAVPMASLSLIILMIYICLRLRSKNSTYS